jgi:protein TonB
MPEPVAMEPLPDIPDLPAPPPEPAAKPSVPSSKTAPRIARTTPRARRDSPAPGGSNATAGSQTGAANAATTDAARLAAGRMPAPSYPAESRRKNQTGTVVVEFTVDHSGRVIAAFAKSPSPWPLLNDEAVRTVRRWRFPPGGIMHLQRPIVFQLR